MYECAQETEALVMCNVHSSVIAILNPCNKQLLLERSTPYTVFDNILSVASEYHHSEWAKER